MSDIAKPPITESEADLRVVGALIISMKHTADALFAAYGQYLRHGQPPAQAGSDSSVPATFMSRAIRNENDNGQS